MSANRRPITLAAAVATAALMGATALSLPAAAAAAAASAEGGPGGGSRLILEDGTLDWGVKDSFRTYVAGPVGQGRTETGGGAGKNADGTFRFTGGSGSYDTGTHVVAAAFSGSVRFTAHEGAMDLELSDLKVEMEGTGTGRILADVSSKDMQTGEVTETDALAVADLTFGRDALTTADGVLKLSAAPATLTEEGAKAFSGFYRPGDALDPVTFTSPYERPGTPSASPSATPGTTPSATPPDSSGGEPAGKPSQSAASGPPGGPESGPGSPDGGTSEQPHQPGRIVDGNLDWGVKESFRTYVTGPAGNGGIEVSGGAADQGGSYRFPKGDGEFDADKPALDASFSGTVRFTAHDGTLDLRFSGLTVKADGKGGSLLADVSSKDRQTGEVTESADVAVAELKLTGASLKAENGILSLTAVPAVLTADGARAFGGFYKAGDALDPVTVNVALDASELPGGTSGGTGGTPGGANGGSDGGVAGGGTTGGSTIGGNGALASTGSDTPAPLLLGVAGVIAAAGAAAVFATRTRNRRTGDHHAATAAADRG